MENERDNSEALWVDACLAELNPPAGWHPDSKRALQMLLKKPETDSKSRWIRVSSLAAILLAVVMVVAILPWHFIWNAALGHQGPAVEPPKTAAPAGIPPRPQNPSTVEQRGGPLREKEAKPLPPLMGSPETTPSQLPPVPVAVQQPEAPPKEENEKPAERVGNGVSAPSCPRPPGEPSYTDEARRERVQGTVTLDVVIGADGAAKVVRVVQGLGYGLDESAIAFAEQFKCTPGTYDSKPVAVSVKIEVNFRLN